MRKPSQEVEKEIEVLNEPGVNETPGSFLNYIEGNGTMGQ
jgi:hypothetical protein